jgi:hypothetical protein
MSIRKEKEENDEGGGKTRNEEREGKEGNEEGERKEKTDASNVTVYGLQVCNCAALVVLRAVIHTLGYCNSFQAAEHSVFGTGTPSSLRNMLPDQRQEDKLTEVIG